MYGHETTDAERKNILDSLEPLFKEAEEKQLWFYSKYAQMWMSPTELRQKHKEDSFIWGPPNWELRNPFERSNELMVMIRHAQEAYDNFQNRIIAYSDTYAAGHRNERTILGA